MSQPTNDLQPPQLFGAQQQATPAGKRSKGALIFGSLAVVFLLAAGGLGALYLTERQTVADQKAEIGSLRDAAAAQEDKLSSTMDSWAEAEHTLYNCRAAIASFAKVGAGDHAAAEEAFTVLLQSCLL